MNIGCALILFKLRTERKENSLAEELSHKKEIGIFPTFFQCHPYVVRMLCFLPLSVPVDRLYSQPLYRSTGCTASLFTGRLAVCTLITGRQTVCLHPPPPLQAARRPVHDPTTLSKGSYYKFIDFNGIFYCLLFWSLEL